MSYEIEIDHIDDIHWQFLLGQFEDTSLYQTWEFAGPSSRTRKVSHIVMKKDDEVVGCCQVRILHAPLLNVGIANITAGPLCRKKGKAFEPEAYIYLLRRIKEEYAIKRGYMLRIWSHETGEMKEFIKRSLEAEGFWCNKLDRPYRTFLMDLSPPLEELRMNLLQKWRNCLNKAEKNGLNIIEGTSDDLFKIYVELADEMCKRKNIRLGVNYHRYGRIQQCLPNSLKMRIMVCYSEDKPVAAAVCSALGDTGIYLLGATGETGLKMNGSYLLQWQMIQWLKENGFRYYDLGAFNQQLNPTVFHFKKGLAGKKECEEVFLNEYDGFFSLQSRISLIMIVRQFLRIKYEALENAFRRDRNKAQ